MRHVIWDWNGTLADDLPTVVRCVNLSLAAIGEAPIVADDYRDHYTRPVRTFYDRLLGRQVTNAEWVTIDEVFHVAYAKAAKQVPLAHDARRAVDLVADSGSTQSILSMWWHDDLVTEVDRHGMSKFMVRVDGNTKDAGETKQRLLDIHLRAIGGDGAVLIGDAVDDALAARHFGIGCIVYDGGSHHRDELERLGAPIAASLLEAAGMAVAGS
jgi:phosphoglycolate phosphatase-like HAD superfamily hydrolase